MIQINHKMMSKVVMIIMIQLLLPIHRDNVHLNVIVMSVNIENSSIYQQLIHGLIIAMNHIKNYHKDIQCFMECLIKMIKY